MPCQKEQPLHLTAEHLKCDQCNLGIKLYVVLNLITINLNVHDLIWIMVIILDNAALVNLKLGSIIQSIRVNVSHKVGVIISRTKGSSLIQLGLLKKFSSSGYTHKIINS